MAWSRSGGGGLPRHQAGGLAGSTTTTARLPVWLRRLLVVGLVGGVAAMSFLLLQLALGASRTAATQMEQQLPALPLVVSSEHREGSEGSADTRPAQRHPTDDRHGGQGGPAGQEAPDVSAYAQCTDCHPTLLSAGWPAGLLAPSFFLLGARQGGTTPLAAYLKLHPQVRLPSKRSLQFFDMYYDRGFVWYARQFPGYVPPAHFVPGTPGPITGEVSVGYLASCGAAARLHSAVPNAKLIVVVREPIERAWSTFLMRQKAGGNSSTVTASETAVWWTEVLAEVEDIQRCEAGTAAAPAWPWTCHCQPTSQHVPGYVVDGLYASHLRRWLYYFPRDQLLVLSSDELDQSPLQVLRRVEAFLGLPRFEYSDKALSAGRSTFANEKADLETRNLPHSEPVRRWYTQANADLKLDQAFTRSGIH